ncbi:YlmH family RNA-binding protein [Lactococcus kimchii]|uniref:YlmH family RNA-binding protein n=1 Tax=Lactococcus sp. S-13 TaxID=2507158 RepID=UPI00102390CA|nr:RNA-binding protein [Lactococcus sp. S-13]RZI49057.1 cell division protein [Lactococcus sp. S-13]
MNEENIYQHFQADERRFIDRCLEWLNRVEDSYAVISTSFLNPRELEILQTLANKRKVQLFSSQLLGEMEQAKVILAPEFYRFDAEDFDLALLEMSYASKFVQISHAQVLGTFLGQTGLKRQEVGDIIVAADKVQIFVSKHVVEIFKAIEKVGRAAVKIREISLTELNSAPNQSVSEVVLVDNLRIDKIIAVAFKVSRNIAANMLESNKIKINYLEIDKKNISVGIGDLISVRGFGRIKISKVLGLTKKGKQKVELEIIKNHKR